jgi:cyclopropane-fatty-acyl-phospholipid synthase
MREEIHRMPQVMTARKAATAKRLVEELCAPLDVRFNGGRQWDVRVHQPDFYERVLAQGSLGLGESYMDGWWSCDAVDQLFDKLLRARLDKKIKRDPRFLLTALKARWTNAQSRSRAFIIGERHYDIGNRLFSVMLDKRMNYSCGYWADAHTLEEAQKAKLDLVCRKLMLEPGMTVLDIGCGWGGFARWAAEKYGVRVCGITVSRKQVAFASEYCKGLDVDIELRDYRDMQAAFDRIVSIGMFEHVGVRNYRNYMDVVRRCLKPDGLFLLHTIAGNTSVSTTDPWIGKYIFPNSMLPSARQICAAAEKVLVLEDWHSFGQYYDPTLMSWHRNFTKNWREIKERYDDRFYRMWTYYLLSCAGSFRARRNQLWQIVFSRDGLRGGYRYRDETD